MQCIIQINGLQNMYKIFDYLNYLKNNVFIYNYFQDK